MEIGARVNTRAGKGKIAFIGETQFAAGEWFGIILDDPKGKNNGSIDGVQYFNTSDKRGLFARRDHVKKLTINVKRNSKLPSKFENSINSPISPRSTKTSPKTTPTKEINIEPEILPEPEPEKPEIISQDKIDQAFKNPSTSVEPSISLAEVNRLRNQLTDWKSKCEILKQKRTEDMAAHRMNEKLKIQLEGIKNDRERLAKNLKMAQEKLEETTQELVRIKDETSDAQENIENAVLEKELAEEKAESLERELEELKEKNEALEIEFEILKNDIEVYGLEGASENFQNDVMEQENERLKEALIHLKTLQNTERDALNRLKSELEIFKKENEKLKSKNTTLIKESAQDRQKITDLLEQVDSNQLAVEQVEKFTEDLLDKDQEIEDLREKCDHYEQMVDMNDQYMECAKDIEIKLREDLDLKISDEYNLNVELEAMKVQSLDYIETIKKYQEYVAEKRDQEVLNENKIAVSSDDIQTLEKKDQQLKIQKQLLETSTAKTALELELGKLETVQLESFSEWLKMFVPNSARQDLNVLNLILLASRLAKKCLILNRLLRTKNIAENSDAARDMVWLCSLLHNTTDKVDEILNTCSQNTWLKFGSLLEEAVVHERCLNIPLELVVEAGEEDAAEKASQAPLEPIKRAIRYFDKIVNIAESQAREEDSEPVNNTGDCRWLKRFILRCEALLLFMNFENSSIFLTESEEKVDLNCSNCSTKSEGFARFVRSLKRKMPPPEGNATCKDLKIPNFSNFEKLFNNLINDFDVIRPIDSSNLENAISNLIEEIQIGKLDIFDDPVIKSNIHERANYFHETLKENSENSLVFKNHQNEIEQYKQEINKLKNDHDFDKAKMEMIALQKNKSQQNYSLNEKVFQEKIDNLKIEHEIILKEKEKALDMLQSEVDKLEKERGGMIKQYSESDSTPISRIEGMVKNKNKSSDFGSNLHGTVVNLDLNNKIEDDTLYQRNLALEMALKNTQKERNKLKAESMLKTLNELPSLDLLVHSKKFKKRVAYNNKLLDINNRFFDAMLNSCKIVKFDENGHLPADQRNLADVNKIEMIGLRKELNCLLENHRIDG